jgi:hypothetical protein
MSIDLGSDQEDYSTQALSDEIGRCKFGVKAVCNLLQLEECRSSPMV